MRVMVEMVGQDRIKLPQLLHRNAVPIWQKTDDDGRLIVVQIVHNIVGGTLVFALPSGRFQPAIEPPSDQRCYDHPEEHEPDRLATSAGGFSG